MIENVGVSAVQLLDALPVAAAVLDGAGRVVGVNDAMQRLWSDSDVRARLGGRGVAHMGVPAEDYALVARGLRDVITGRAPRFTLEYPRRSAAAERWFRLVATPLDGGALVLHLDITGEYARISNWLTGTSVAVVELDTTLAASFVNESWRRVAGSDRWDAPLDPVDALALNDGIERSILDRAPFSRDVRVGRRWYRFAVNPDSAVDGRVRRVVLVGLDVTSERQHVAQAAADVERGRLAAELHDTVVQRLYGTALAMQRTAGDGYTDAGALHDAIGRLDRCIADLRAVDRPARALHGSLAGEVEAVLVEARAPLGYAPAARIDVDLDTVPAAVASHLVPVLTEALSNVARHAGAMSCDVHLTCCDDSLLLTVTDDGRGMPQAPRRTNGTRHIVERAVELGGCAQWDPAPLGGTVLTWRVPLLDAVQVAS